MNFVPAAGFANPVTDANATFRALLNALAHPGRLFALPSCPEAPASLGAGLGGILLALADRDTPLWLAPNIDTPEAAAWIGFHTGAPMTADREKASFAAMRVGSDALPLDGFALGTSEYPDRSTTLLIAVQSLHEGAGLSLSGPGIAGINHLLIEGVDRDFWSARAELAPLYPLGLDMIFCAHGLVAALPRTTVVETPRQQDKGA